ncbi:MAG: heavy-metal-associated domain-containing protein [Gammaproteobacteria bacterium]|nr:heavy-metal-associated domain-containing protein [Gammaproteobacteria bacterium]
MICVLSALANFSMAATTTLVTVNGMVCAFCAQGIEKRLLKLPETQAVFVNLKQKIVAVEAKPNQAVSEALIKSEIADAGYAVVKFETVEKSVDDIKAEYAAKNKK